MATEFIQAAQDDGIMTDLDTESLSVLHDWVSEHVSAQSGADAQVAIPLTTVAEMFKTMISLVNPKSDSLPQSPRKSVSSR